jgi:hypothetical protein
MARKTSSRRPAKKAAVKRKAVAKRKGKPAKRKPARRKLANKRKPAKGKPRLTTATRGGRAMPRKFADTDQQIGTLRHHVSAQCVSIASSIDTIPPEMIPVEMRDRWLHELRQAAVALVPVIERLATGQTTEPSR